ncbi:MAG: hypothetical protein LBR50_11215 [Tannerella sp.]|jgi:hypothetical protein|nr:hypothetical protein [Tannerella sp.]
MKPLLLSFFAVILCYSLFFEKDDISNHVDDTNFTIQSKPSESLLHPDSATFYAVMTEPK